MTVIIQLEVAVTDGDVEMNGSMCTCGHVYQEGVSQGLEPR